jgi:cytochrome c2
MVTSSVRTLGCALALVASLALQAFGQDRVASPESSLLVEPRRTQQSTADSPYPNKTLKLRRGTGQRLAGPIPGGDPWRGRDATSQFLASRTSAADADRNPDTRQGSGQAAPANLANESGVDLSLVQQGGTAFNDNCISCHDAEKSFGATKNLAGWRDTVRKMAAKEDADIPERVHESIAQFLAARNASGNVEQGEKKREGPNSEKPAAATTKEKFDPALVQQGTTAFNNYCVSCHDAQKSTSQTKTVAGWQATVRRMAQKDGAQIPENVHESISVYLASLGASGKESGAGSAETTPSFSANATMSAMYRATGNGNLEDPGHFGDAWIGFAWQNKGPVSARVTTCITCHIQGLQLGNIDLVEACARLDLNKLLSSGEAEKTLVKANIEAGRFVVPFGAYYQQVNPGVNRSVSSPLIYNMGLRVYPNDLGDPVLPMPYSDSGASLNVTLPFKDSTNMTMNGYVVNGLQGGPAGVDFYQSRSYVDNNRWPAGGGRVTIGGANLRLGASATGGRFNIDAGTGPLNQGMHYFIYGADAVFRWKDVVRLQFEYAERDSDRLQTTPTTSIFRDRIGGYYLQGEVLVFRDWRISLFSRFDSQLTHSPSPPLGSQLTTGNFSVDRITYGVNWSLPGGSLLMVNLEQWLLPSGFNNINVLGLRWASTF